MPKDSFEPIPDLDGDAVALIEAIRNESTFDGVTELIGRLDEHIFRKYCAKPYLTEPDPPYCSYFQTGTCRYVNLLGEILDRYGIKVTARTRS